MRKSRMNRVRLGQRKRHIVHRPGARLFPSKFHVHDLESTSKMTSSSTGVPSGRLATPYTRRQGFCLFRIRLAAVAKQRPRFSAVRGHLPKSRPTRRALQCASLCPAIPNASARPRARRAPRGAAPCTGFHIELRSDAPNEFRLTAFRRKNPGQRNADYRSARPPPKCRMAPAAPGACCQVLSTAARRCRVETFRE